ncbi:uncharacterized protein LOC130810908 [Amaranthus tricolor]|uniref:uncharacterized protein LOC130810908 n=1 Tax=Amaranthus tricolor TaxID=29722 RepID=UPI002590A7C2|nr:uncharacterized protein LOC130810908 [Amaranthus tricolor]
MDRIMQSLRRKSRLKQLQLVVTNVVVVLMMYWVCYMTSVATVRGVQLIQNKRDRKILRLIQESDVHCKTELRVNRQIFNIICEMLKEIGSLTRTKNVSLDEIVTMFLYTLAHHKNNRSIAHFFIRSGETVSRQFNLCRRAILKLHEDLLYKPTPILEECEDERWKPFKNCLEALDGTYINVTIHPQGCGKYRTRKCTVAMNVLGVCAPNMQFIYVLPGWKGSAHDVRVLRKALTRPNGFRVPRDDVEEENMSNDDSDNDSDDEVEYVTTIATSDRWTNYRNTLTQDLFNAWRTRVRQGT